MKITYSLALVLTLSGLLPVLAGGSCSIDLSGLPNGNGNGNDPDIDRIENKFQDRITGLQQDDPRAIGLPNDLEARGDTVIINNNVTIINNFQQDVIVTQLPDSLWLAFENVTGFDDYIEFLADGVLQSVFVLDGETLLLDYPCLPTVDLLTEEQFDIFTGESIAFFELNVPFDLGLDYNCGEALIFSFEPDAIFVQPDVINLLN